MLLEARCCCKPTVWVPPKYRQLEQRKPDDQGICYRVPGRGSESKLLVMWRGLFGSLLRGSHRRPHQAPSTASLQLQQLCWWKRPAEMKLFLFTLNSSPLIPPLAAITYGCPLQLYSGSGIPRVSLGAVGEGWRQPCASTRLGPSGSWRL